MPAITEPTAAPGPTVDPATREHAEAHLRRLVGRDDAVLRDDQWTAIEALAVHRRRALVVQRTGWGKSAVYFVATALLRAAGAGPTVIVSPLLALMRNQIEAAERAGIRAVTINSTNLEDWEAVHADIAEGGVDVLLVSPERLNNPSFRDEVLPRLAATTGLLVVDEAHCISDWGHDFRPDYRRIRTLLGDLAPGIPVLATTATANERVTRDVAEQLATTRAAAPGSDDGLAEAGVLVLRGSLDRESLRLGVVRLATPQQRLAWLAQHLGDLPGSGIVYCLTVAATEEVAEHLRAAGHDVAAYSGRTETSERQALEADLAGGRVKALVATSALGMGFDATLGFVVNLGAPASPVSYYQQVGRAGRGTPDAPVVLLPAREDRDIWAYFASLAFPREQQVREAIAAIADAGRPIGTPTLETHVDLNRTRLETMLKVLDVDGAVRRVRGGWEATGQEWVYDADRYRRVAEAREAEQAAMLDYLDTDGCRMLFLRRQLDDPGSQEGAEPCGRCDNCGGLDLDTSVDGAALGAAEDALARPGVTLAPRKMWPSALANLGLDERGKIGDGPDEGRAIARLTDLGHGQALRALFAPGRSAEPADDPAGDTAPDPAPETVLPDGLARAMVEVLDDWPEVRGATGVAYVDSARRPGLVREVATGVARRLGVPIVARMAIADAGVEPDRGAANSAQRVAAVSRRYAMQTAPGAEVRGTVVLVDDRQVTGWTMTVAGRALRAAGAERVLPLALALQG